MRFREGMSGRSAESGRSGYSDWNIGREERMVGCALVDQFEFVCPVKGFLETKTVLTKTGDAFHTFYSARFGEVSSTSVERSEEDVAARNMSLLADPLT